MIAAAAIVGGYASLIYVSGWAGLLVAVAHIAAMLFALRE